MFISYVICVMKLVRSHCVVKTRLITLSSSLCLCSYSVIEYVEIKIIHEMLTFEFLNHQNYGKENYRWYGKPFIARLHELSKASKLKSKVPTRGCNHFNNEKNNLDWTRKSNTRPLVRHSHFTNETVLKDIKVIERFY